MRFLNDLGKPLALLLAFSLVLPLPVEARTRAGDKYYKAGREAEQRHEFERALELYEKAYADDPGEPGYQLAARRVRFPAGMARLALGQKLREQGKLEEAMIEFQKAYAIDPSSSIAEQELKRTK